MAHMKSAPAESKAHATFQPYVPASKSQAEFTVKAIVLGALFGLVFGASTVYLGLRAGLGDVITASVIGSRLAIQWQVGVIGRFVPFVRTYITVVAGVTLMERRRFFTWSAVGAVLWVLSITLLGYFLGRTFPSLGENIDKAIIAILAFSVIPIVYEWWRHRRTSSKAADDNDHDGVPDLDIMGRDTREHG